MPVSIPFIAGQWSLQKRKRRMLRQPGGFNPLHCGAVVASWKKTGDDVCGLRVSIPFIAGQWSLLPTDDLVRRIAADVSIPFIAGQWSLPAYLDEPPGWRLVVSQSPSLRGSGRFPNLTRRRSSSASGLNPLHCGAVVAS